MKISTLKISALTLVELMVSLIIATTLILIGTTVYTGLKAKEDLKKAAFNLESAIIKAQNESQRRGQWTCLDFSTDGNINVYLDDNDDHGQNATSCGGTDARLATYDSVIKDPISLANCSLNITTSCKLWIDENGYPMLCSNSGSCGQAITVPSNQTFNCVPWHYQIILSSTSLESQSRAKELELSQDGLIHLPKLDEKGSKETLWVKSPVNPTGSGACE